MIMQPARTRICGQVAVANLANITLEESFAAFKGHRRGTSVRRIMNALGKLGFDVPYARLQRLAIPPQMAIAKMRWRRPDGTLRGFHWVAIKEGQILDGLAHLCPGEVTSYLVVLR